MKKLLGLLYFFCVSLPIFIAVYTIVMTMFFLKENITFTFLFSKDKKNYIKLTKQRLIEAPAPGFEQWAKEFNVGLLYRKESFFID